VPDGNALAVRRTSEELNRDSTIRPRKLTELYSQVAHYQSGIARRRTGDVAELVTDAPELEDAAGALEGVLGLRELAGFEGGAQVIVRNRNGRWERSVLVLRQGRFRDDNQENGEEGRQAQASHQ
jgi:hypothetical protein